MNHLKFVLPVKLLCLLNIQGDVRITETCNLIGWMSCNWGSRNYEAITFAFVTIKLRLLMLFVLFLKFHHFFLAFHSFPSQGKSGN